MVESLGHPWLQGLETPYLWRPSEPLDPRERTNLLQRLQDKDRESRENNKRLTFNNFVVNLVLGYELFATANDAAAAAAKLDQLEMDLFTLDIVSNCSFYLQVRRAQWHTLLASRAVLLASTERLEQSRQVVEDNFDPVSVFNLAEKSAIIGIKSRTNLEYGPTAWPEALRLAKEAILLNPKEAEWYFLVGKALERIRLEVGDLSRIPKEEIDNFERAVAIGGRGNHMVHLAKVYDRLTYQMQYNTVDNKNMKSGESFTHRSFELLKSALKDSKNNTKMQLCCLKGLLRKPHRTLVKEEVKGFMKELFRESKKIKMFFSVAGKYYLKLEKDKQRAIQYFEKGSKLGDFSCSMNCLWLRYELGQVDDVERALVQLVARYSDTSHHGAALCHLGAWQLLGKRDLPAALDTFTTALELGPAATSTVLTVHKPIFVRCLRPLNLLHVLYNEVVLAPEGILPIQQKDKLFKFLTAREPSVVSKPADSRLLDKILKNS